jgi:hypothetical protein
LLLTSNLMLHNRYRSYNTVNIDLKSFNCHCILLRLTLLGASGTWWLF